MAEICRTDEVLLNITGSRALFTGKVVGSEFFGLYIKYQLEVEGQILKCIDKNTGRQYLKKGDLVEVGIEPDDLMIY